MNRSILITDDEPAIRESLALFLVGEGFTCQVAKDGREAIEKAAATSFDIILMDLRMPRQGGFEAIQKIKENNPHAVFIIITAYYHIEEAAIALQHGASALLLKPIDFDELTSVINRHLPKKK
ncbi:MAG: response regulator [Balneolaceae bacterium]|nr:response regulator [Balneolaceae bacterium]